MKHVQLDQVLESPAIAGESFGMTALEIFAVTAGLLVNGYLAISELRVDYLQRSHMKRLVADGYARWRAARSRRRYVRRVLREGKLARKAPHNHNCVGQQDNKRMPLVGKVPADDSVMGFAASDRAMARKGMITRKRPKKWRTRASGCRRVRSH